MASETIPQYCTRADEWNTSIAKGFIAKHAKQQENVAKLSFIIVLR